MSGTGLGQVMSVKGLMATRGSFHVGPLSLTIEPGEAVALVGPNGSGKSTVILAVLGLLQRSSGQVEINGQPVDHRSPPQGVGAVLAWSGFYDWLSGEKNLILACERDRHALDRVGRLLDELGLAHAAQRPVSTYSTGMRKRLELARSLLSEPRILVLDEPTNGLDETGWSWLAQELDQRRQAGCSLLLATHDQQFVEQLSARVLRMDAGTLTPGVVL